MLGMPCGVRFTVSSQRSLSELSLPLAARSKEGIHSADSCARRAHLWQNVVCDERWNGRRGGWARTFPYSLGSPTLWPTSTNSSSPATLWCIWPGKSWCLGFRQAAPRSQCSRSRSFWVDCHLDASDAKIPSETLGPVSAGPIEKIQTFCALGQLDKALDTLSCMNQLADAHSLQMYRSLLAECSKRKDLGQAKRVHALLVQRGLDRSSILGEQLVCTLIKCGALKDAAQVFCNLPFRSVASWNTLLSGYSCAGQGQEALRLFQCMQDEGSKPDTYSFVILIKCCNTVVTLKWIHAEAARFGYQSDLFVGTCMVNAYAKYGRILDAQYVFDGLPQRNSVSWNAMLTAHMQRGQAGAALQLYKGMLEEGFGHDDRTLVKALQACSMLAEEEDPISSADGLCFKANALKLGKVIHSDAWRTGHREDLFVLSSLVGMYGKCGSIGDAQVVFDELPQRDLVTWNSMLSVFVQQGQGEEALRLYERMLHECVSGNDRTFVSVLQACAALAEKADGIGDAGCVRMGFLSKGKALHAEARRRGYDADIYVGNSLVSMYGKCGNLGDAQYMFDGMLLHDDVSWNTLLAAYAQQGDGEMALKMYEQMHHEGVSPSDRTLVSVLQGCGMLADEEDAVDEMLIKWKSLERAKAVHADAKRRGFDSDVFVSCSLIGMYGKCGSTVDAQNAFDKLSQRDVVSWTVLMAAYVQQDQAEKVLQLYEQMRVEGASPNDRTMVNILQACCILADEEDEVDMDGQVTKPQSLGRGKAIHAEAWRTGHHQQLDVFVGSTLISMYSKCGSVVDSQDVFDRLSQRDVVAWSAIVAAYVLHGQADDAVEHYVKMQEANVSPNVWTFASVIHACGMVAEKEVPALNGQVPRLESLKKGKVVHANAWKKGCEQDVFIGSTLIRMYGKCGSMVDAEIVFGGLVCRDVGLWNALLAAYHQQDQGAKALDLYEKMLEGGVTPDASTYATALQAYGSLAEKDTANVQGLKMQYLAKGRAMHADTCKTGCDTDLVVSNSLITMYSKCGSISDAHVVFDRLCARDAVSWNAMLAAYVEHEQGDRALQLYGQMQQEGVAPTPVTLLSIVQACSSTGDLDMCRQMHQTAMCLEKNQLSPPIATTLIHAYGNLAAMADAQSVFNSLPEPVVASWNALITGYAREGNYAASLERYQQMLLTDCKPDKVTFLALLSACNHAGLVDKGVQYFESMSRDYDLAPDSEHYVSLVDLLGRAGHFTMVEHLLSSMPMEPDLAMWSCLLGSCRKHGKVVLAKKAFDRAVRIDPTQSATYILMANIYSDAGLWDLAKQVAESSQAEISWKKPGQSWTQHEHTTYTFMAGDRNHPPQQDLFDVLEQLAPETYEGHVLREYLHERHVKPAPTTNASPTYKK